MLIDPDNLGMRYNLACDLVISLARLRPGARDAAARLAAGGREQIAWLKSDPDMDPLRDDPRFKKLIEDAERRLTSIQP